MPEVLESKICSICKQEKKLINLKVDKRVKSGYASICKRCNSKQQSKRAKDQGESFRERERENSRRFHSRNPEKWSEYAKKNRKNNSHKWKPRYNSKKASARARYWRAVKSGKIVRKNRCEYCDSKVRIHAHHHDYDKPLEVTYACHKCHMKKHSIHQKHLLKENRK